MSKLTTAAKRLLVGRPFRSDKLAHTLLPKRIALPVFASDALSSVAYAPQEIFAVLSVAGLAAYAYAPWIAGLVALVMIVVVLSYRQNVHAYPSGGGDYEVVTKNLGPTYGLLVASALLVDYILTVAVSTAAGVANIGSAIQVVGDHPVWFSIGIIVLVCALNLRGIRESGSAFAIPVYAFIISIVAMIITGLVEFVIGADVKAQSADFHLQAESALTGFALVFLLLRGFSSGSAALTGVEAISNGVPAFKKPKSRNAATTLALMAALSVSMMLGLVALTLYTGVQFADDPATQLIGAPEGYYQKTLIAQIAEAVFSGFPLAFYIVSFTTGLILVLACNTAFNGFPVLGSILAQDRFLPRQLHTRGDRLAFSNGIVFLAAIALILVIAFQADVTALIQLYIVGVFVSFTFSQLGMIKHWNKLLRTERDGAVRRRYRRSQTINAVGFCFTGVVLIIVLITKFLAGAWIALLAMAVIFVTMQAIKRHYERVAQEIAADEDDLVLPSRVHAIVLVSKLHLPTMRALAFARATRPDTLEAVTVNVDPEDTADLAREWEDRQIPVSLKVIDSPFREITKPVLDYVRRARKNAPRDVVTVFIPEYVVGHWWEHLLHNQSALRLKGRLLFTPGVMVTSVPWQLSSSEALDERIRLRAERSPYIRGRKPGSLIPPDGASDTGTFEIRYGDE
ncbi:APC family permease [Nakamurella multipartita]|uniref:Amino acid transporter n=1 Tax=Nakamurella multipartita (strain ATCC 700099 / DSM 44233 / CIP 104796 / JCM 9543 / NBRC 105858 / Y-104) TaxID=479431 RepID=C8XG51_NAKMY|nr:APC family permease [Nakamurella multipartita]ACV80053.1 amino acid transporter [Nakamurella multipartita DSM 44233]